MVSMRLVRDREMGKCLFLSVGRDYARRVMIREPRIAEPSTLLQTAPRIAKSINAKSWRSKTQAAPTITR